MGWLFESGVGGGGGIPQCSFDYLFDMEAEIPCIPFAQALVDVSQEHFAFFSAAEAPQLPLDVDEAHREEMMDGEEIGEAELDGEEMEPDVGSPMTSRLAKVEGSVNMIMKELQLLRKAGTSVAPLKKPTLKAKAKAKAAGSGGKPSTSTRVPVDLDVKP